MSENGIIEPTFDQTISRIWGHLEAPPAEVSSPQPVATKKIAIVGRAPDTMNMAPFDDPSWEIWSLSNAASIGAIKRWDVWFELHDLDEGQKRWQKAYWDWLATDHGKPLFIAAPHAHVPHGIVYPWQQVFNRFGRYFNNSIAEMLAIALLEGCTDLGLYGVNMAQSDPVMHNGNAEYQHQRPSCEYMLGVARGMGVNVIVPDESDLLKCARIYGLQSDVGHTTRKVQVRMQELHQRKKEAETQRDGHAREMERWAQVVIKFEGAIEDCEFWKNKLQA